MIEFLWIILTIFIFPTIFFVGLYRIGKFFISIINKKFHKQFSSSWAYLLLMPLPLFFILFFAGGCSFKYMDPQYYEFKRLCNINHNKVNIYNYEYRDMRQEYRRAMRDNENIKVGENGVRHYYYKKLNLELSPVNWKEVEVKSHSIGFGIGDIIEKEIDDWYVSKDYNVKFANFKRYIYVAKGFFLKGDEGAGWHWENKETLDCTMINTKG